MLSVYKTQPISDPGWCTEDRVLGCVQNLITLCLIQQTEQVMSVNGMKPKTAGLQLKPIH